MKKRTISGILIILVLVAWGVLSHGFKENPLNPFYPFVIQEKVIKEDLKDGSINIKYPVTKSALLNETIVNFIDAQEDDFKDNISGLGDISSASGSLDISYRSYISDKIVSLNFDVNTDTGGAHGNLMTVAFNYDKDLNKILLTEDIFSDQANYLVQLSNLVKPLLKIELEKLQFQDDTWLETGAGALENNYKQFVFTKDGLTFFFDPYQVAPYAAGAQEITLPYQSLSSLLRPEYSYLKF
jgi:hypothetical protein